MRTEINKLADIFARMVSSYNAFGQIWKNIPLGHKAFGMMKGLPDIVPGEFDTPEIKVAFPRCDESRCNV